MWARGDGREVVVGVTSILAAVAGKLGSVSARPSGGGYTRGRAIGALESGKYFGTLKTPVSGVLVAVNEAVLRKPKVLSESPYRDGWFARLRPTDWAADRDTLLSIDAAKGLLESQIAALHVRCFAAFPDYEMFEIGTECAAVLVKLNDLLGQMEIGEVVHLVSDDWTAPVEMDRWSTEMRQPVVDTRKEGNLYHFLVRKAR
jgi:glycine cleavage system H protein